MVGPQNTRRIVGAPLPDALTIDSHGNECLVGLTAVETREYRLMQKIALHGDDGMFLRYVELGDKHEAALIRLQRESGTGSTGV